MTENMNRITNSSIFQIGYRVHLHDGCSAVRGDAAAERDRSKVRMLLETQL